MGRAHYFYATLLLLLLPLLNDSLTPRLSQVRPQRAGEAGAGSGARAQPHADVELRPVQARAVGDCVV